MALDTRFLMAADDAGVALARSGIIDMPNAPKKAPHRSGKARIEDQAIALVDSAETTAGHIGLIGFAFPILGFITGGLSKLHIPGMTTAAGKVKAVEQVKFADIHIPVISNLVSGVTNATMSGLAAVADMLPAGLKASRAEAWEAKAAAREGQFLQHAQMMLAMPAHPQLRGSMQELQGALSLGGGRLNLNNAKQVTAALENVKEAAHGVGASPLAKLAGKAEKHAARAVEAHTMTNGWSALSHNIRNAPKKMGNASAVHGLMNGSFLAGAGLMQVHTGLDAKKGVALLKEMYADLTHTKADDISSTQLLFGKVPEVVSAARTQLFKEFGPAVIIDAANTVLNLDMVCRHRPGMGGMIVGALTMAMFSASSMARGALHGNILPSYMAIKEAHEAKEAAPREEYAKLVGEACPELWQRGGMNCEGAKALGEAYANAQLPAIEVLREVADGRMKQRLEKLQTEYAQAHPHDAHPAHSGQTNQQHVAQLSGRKDKAHHAVVGTHTKREVARAQAHAHAAVGGHRPSPQPA